MTDYSGWTDEQVNEAILHKLGWKSHGCDWCTSLHWFSPEGFIATPPDYTHSWELCGELLEEFDKWRSAGVFFDPRGKWQSFFVEIPDQGYSWFEADTPQRAICEAWLAWKEQG